MIRHALSGDAAEATDALYNGKRLDDEAPDLPPTKIAVRRRTDPYANVIGGLRPVREPWRQELIDRLYAETGEP